MDPGERRIGVAKSDGLGFLASPLTICDSLADLVTLLEPYLQANEVHGVVVGMPYNMSGTIGPIGERSLRFVAQLRAQVDVPIYLWDERLTSQQAAETGAGKRRGAIDHKAAAILLQAYLDAGTPVVDDPDGPAVDFR